MNYSNLFNKFIEYQDTIQSFIMFFGIIASGFFSCYLHKLSKKENKILHQLSKEEKQKDFLNSQLFELQRLSFNEPYVEDKNFTKEWDRLREQYTNNTISEQEKRCFLQYDVYTEMLFNYMRQALDFYKNEEELLNYVDFKSWIRDHKKCWYNPRQEHSNMEVYGEDMWNMIDKWLK